MIVELVFNVMNYIGIPYYKLIGDIFKSVKYIQYANLEDDFKMRHQNMEGGELAGSSVVICGYKWLFLPICFLLQ